MNLLAAIVNTIYGPVHLLLEKLSLGRHHTDLAVKLDVVQICRQIYMLAFCL